MQSARRSVTKRSLPVAVALAAALAVATAGAKEKARRPPGQDAGEVRTFADLVDGMEETGGLLTFYRSPEKLYLRVPDALVGAPLGFSAVLVHAAGDFRPRGSVLDNQLVVWERAGRHLVLTKKNLDFRADAGSPLHAAVGASYPDSPVFQAPLVVLRDEPPPLVVEAGGLFSPSLAPILPPASGFRPGPDGLLESLKGFPDNVVARVRYRFEGEPRGPGGGPERAENPFARFATPGRLADPRTVEVVVEYTLFRLPDDGFRPRRADQRIGGFEQDYKDYTGIDGLDTAFRHVLIRWDVRKSDPAAAVSPAAEPITFYLDRSVPAEWRPLAREATLWWNDAFEKVGIRDAVRVLDPPDDPDWDPADIHHSVIYWNVSDDLVFSGMAGPSLFDPRTGKVLKANVYLNAEFFSYSLHRYLVYAWWRAPEPGAAAERRRLAAASRFFCDRAPSFSSQIAFARMVLEARGILRPGTPEADRFAREAFMELVAHEVGHALGFPHNWKASLVSSWEDVAAGRVDGTHPDRMFSASVMDYNPIYLAPRGAPQGDYFLRGLGPYDMLSVDYVYRPFDGMSAEEEARALDAVAARAEVAPGLAYDSGELGDIDPTSSSDDFGDQPLAFAESRLAMIREEVLPRLADLVLAEGHDYDRLREALDAAIFSVAMDYVDIAARHVGGQILHRRVANSPSRPPGGPPPILPVPAATQRRALEVLERHAFADGAYALPPEVMALLKANLLFDWNYPWRYASDYDLGRRIAGLQAAALSTLLEPRRLARLLDDERRAEAGADRFTLPELFERLEAAAFDGAPGSLSADRRSLQRLLVEGMADLALAPPRGAPAEASQVAARTLRSIDGRLARALAAGPSDGYTAAHLEALSARIRRTLEAGISLPAE